MEIWKEFAAGYEVSTLGNVRSWKRSTPRLIKVTIPNNGYKTVRLSIAGKIRYFTIHRLVAEAFIPNPENKPQVNHINGVKTDNRVENLEWVTRSENQLHAVANGLKKSGEENYRASITNEQATWLRTVYKPFDKEFGAAALARKLDISQSAVKYIVHGKHYKTATGTPIVSRTPAQPIPENVRAEIRQLYRKNVVGCGALALARKFNCSVKSIQRIVREIQPPTKTSGEPCATAEPQLTGSPTRPAGLPLMKTVDEP